MKMYMYIACVMSFIALQGTLHGAAVEVQQAQDVLALDVDKAKAAFEQRIRQDVAELARNYRNKTRNLIPDDTSDHSRDIYHVLRMSNKKAMAMTYEEFDEEMGYAQARAEEPLSPDDPMFDEDPDGVLFLKMYRMPRVSEKVVDQIRTIIHDQPSKDLYDAYLTDTLEEAYIKQKLAY
jgi:hypothetical protein